MIHALRQANALSKCLFALSASVFVFACQDWRILTAHVLVLFGLLALSRDLDRCVLLILLAFVGSMPVWCLLFILGGVEKAGSWREGVPLALDWFLLYALRLLVVVLVDILLVKWTTFSNLTTSLRSLRLPGSLVLFASTVVNILPTIFSMAMHVIEVQRCRGFDPKQLLRPWNFLPLFVPIFLAQLKRATELALSLELRGLGVSAKLPPPRLRPRLGDLLFVAVAVAIWFTPFSLPGPGGLPSP